jgi:hypothetical protein
MAVLKPRWSRPDLSTPPRSTAQFPHVVETASSLKCQCLKDRRKTRLIMGFNILISCCSGLSRTPWLITEDGTSVSCKVYSQNSIFRIKAIRLGGTRRFITVRDAVELYCDFCFEQLLLRIRNAITKNGRNRNERASGPFKPRCRSIRSYQPCILFLSGLAGITIPSQHMVKSKLKPPCATYLTPTETFHRP